MSDEHFEYKNLSLYLSSDKWVIRLYHTSSLRCVKLSPQELAENVINRDLREMRGDNKVDVETIINRSIKSSKL